MSNRRAFCDITNQVNVNNVNSHHNRCKSSPPRVTKCRMRLEDLGQPVQRFVKELRKEGCVPNGRLALLKYVSVKQLAVVYDSMANGKPASLIWGDIEEDLLAQCKDYNNGELDVDVDMNDTCINMRPSNTKRELSRCKSESCILQSSPSKLSNTEPIILNNSDDQQINNNTPKQEQREESEVVEHNPKRIPRITLTNNAQITSTPPHQCSHTSMDITPEQNSPENTQEIANQLCQSPPVAIFDEPQDDVIQTEQFKCIKTSELVNCKVVILFDKLYTTSISTNYSYYTTLASINDLFIFTKSLSYCYYTTHASINDLFIFNTTLRYSYYTSSATINDIWIQIISYEHIPSTKTSQKQLHNVDVFSIEFQYCSQSHLSTKTICDSHHVTITSPIYSTLIQTTTCVLDLSPAQAIFKPVHYNNILNTPTDKISRDMGTQWPEIPQGSPSCPPSSTVSLDLLPVVIIPDECVLMSESQNTSHNASSSTENSEDNELFPSMLELSNIPNESNLHTRKSWSDIMKKRKQISEKKMEEDKKRLEVATKLELQKKKEEEQKQEEERRRNEDRIKRELERMRREEEKVKKEEERNREAERRREEERRKREQEKVIEENKKQEELIRKQKERLAKEEEAKKKREERLKRAASSRCQCCSTGRGTHSSPSKSS